MKKSTRKNKIVVNKKDMKDEHIPLIRILESGTKEERMKEAKKQRKEMKDGFDD